MSGVGNRLRALREAKAMTQAQLGAALDVSRQTIIALESGRYMASLELSLKIARHFLQPVEAIFWLQDGQ